MESRSKGEGFSSCRERRNEERQYHLDENREIWVCMIGYVKHLLVYKCMHTTISFCDELCNFRKWNERIVSATTHSGVRIMGENDWTKLLFFFPGFQICTEF